MEPLEYYRRLGLTKIVNGQEVLDTAKIAKLYGNQEVTEREKVEEVEEPQSPERFQPEIEVIKNKDVTELIEPPQPKLIGKEPYLEEEEKKIKKLKAKYARPAPPEEKIKKKKKIINVEIIPRPKFKRKLDFSPEESFSDDDVFAPRVYYDYNFSPFDFLSRSRTFAPRISYDYEYAPEEFSSYSDIYSPSQSYDNTFAPKYRNFRKSVYSPSTITKNKFAPRSSTRIAFKPRLFDKLLAIFAPEAILKQKEDVKFKPYNYQYEETAIIDTYNPEQITTVQKFAPKDESNFSLRIAPETDFSIKLSPPPISFTTVDYYGILKKIIR